MSSRLVEDDERKWTEENINNIALKHFPNIDRNTALARPILYSNWLSKDYMPVEQEELRDFVKARLKVKSPEFVESWIQGKKMLPLWSCLQPISRSTDEHQSITSREIFGKLLAMQ